MKTKDILIIVVIVVLLSIAGYYAFIFIQIVPIAIEFHGKPSQDQIDQREQGQEIFNSLLD